MSRNSYDMDDSTRNENAGNNSQNRSQNNSQNNGQNRSQNNSCLLYTSDAADE